MQGTVTKFGTTKNGKSTIYIDQKMYFVGRCDVAGLQPGDRIDFEAHAFSDDGKLWGLDKWGKIPNGAPKLGDAAANPDANFKQAPTTAGGSLDEPLLRFISNCVGSAIEAKTITDPCDMEIWARGAYAAYRAVMALASKS